MIISMRRKAVRYPIALALAAVLASLLLGGCEKFFTTNLLSGLQRDPANLSPEQQIQYAQQALSSGDAAAMKSAFDALTAGGLSGMSTEQKVLAVQCANGAQDIQSQSATIAAQWNAWDDVGAKASIDSLSQSIDATLAAEAAAILDTLTTSTPGITAGDFALAAITQGLVAAKLAGGVDNLNPAPTSGDPEYPSYTTAQGYFTNAETILNNNGQSSDTVSGIAGLFNA